MSSRHAASRPAQCPLPVSMGWGLEWPLLWWMSVLLHVGDVLCDSDDEW